jgi:Nanos RNA binding domain
MSAFCKVCKDAGRTSAEFNSHWTKDRSGNTTCPLLLAQECRWCHELGHTVKYCKKLAEKNARENSYCQPQPAARPPVAARPAAAAATNKSKFAVLMDDDSDDETAEKKAPEKKAPEKKEEFPALQGNWAKVLRQEQCQARPTFASIAAIAPKANPVAAKELPAGFANLEPRRDFNLAEYTKAFPPTNNAALQTLRLNGVKCWADMEDEEDDEELTEYERDMQAVEQYCDRCRD